MFVKKPVKVSSSNPLGGKEAKKLRMDLTKRMRISDAELDTFFGLKDKLMVNKLVDPSTVTVYANDEEPYFIDIGGGKGDFFPTIYSAWKCQALGASILPALPIQAPVSKFVINGADLMLPGVAIGIEGGPLQSPEDMPDFEQGSLMLIYCIGNPMPIAVGQMTMSKKAAIAGGMKGKCMRVIHTYKDTLWESGSGFAPPGFLKAPLDSGAWVEATEAGGAGHAPPAAAAGGGGQEASADVQEVAKAVESVSLSGGGGGGGGDAKAKWEALSPDKMAENMLLEAIKTRVKPSDIPCECSKFWKDFVQPVLPDGVKLDIKTTSFKKLSKFLSTAEKKKLLKVAKVFGQECVDKIDFEHKDVVAYVPEVAETKAVASGEFASRQSFMEGCRPNNNILPIVGGSKEDFYTNERFSEKLQEYAKANNLLEGDKFKVDKDFYASVYKKVKEEERPDIGAMIPFEKALADLKVQTSECFQVEVDGKVETHKGKPQKIVIVAEDRQAGRKFATNVRNLEHFSIDPDAFAKALQKKFSTSASVNPLPGKTEKGVEVSVQGNVLQELIEFIKKEHKVTSEFIDAKDKTKK